MKVTSIPRIIQQAIDGMQNDHHFFVSSMLFSSQLDLINLDKQIYVKSLYYWKQMNPLLKCSVFKSNNKKRFFKLMATSDIIDEESQLKNVDIFKLDESSSERSDEFWRLLYERELNTKPSNQSGLLWRLHLIQLKKSKYIFIFNIHHALIERS